MNKLIEFTLIILLALSYVIVYDMARLREQGNCKDEVLIRDIQLKSMVEQERKLRHYGWKAKQ
jgi:hypothetical protein